MHNYLKLMCKGDRKLSCDFYSGLPMVFVKNFNAS